MTQLGTIPPRKSVLTERPSERTSWNLVKLGSSCIAASLSLGCWRKGKKKQTNNNKAGQYSSKIPFSSARPENWVAVGQTGPACWSSKSASSWPTPSTGHSTSTVPTRRVQTPSQQQRRAWWHLVHPEHNSQLPQISCEPLSWMQGSKGQGRNYFWFDLPTTWLYEFVTIWLFKASVSLRACFVLIWQ